MTNKDQLAMAYVQTKTVAEYARVLAKDEKHIQFDLSHSDAWKAGFDYARANPSVNGDAEAT